MSEYLTASFPTIQCSRNIFVIIQLAMENSVNFGMYSNASVSHLWRILTQGLVRHKRAKFLATKHNQVMMTISISLHAVCDNVFQNVIFLISFTNLRYSNRIYLTFIDRFLCYDIQQSTRSECNECKSKSTAEHESKSKSKSNADKFESKCNSDAKWKSTRSTTTDQRVRILSAKIFRVC